MKKLKLLNCKLDLSIKFVLSNKINDIIYNQWLKINTTSRLAKFRQM